MALIGKEANRVGESADADPIVEVVEVFASTTPGRSVDYNWA